METLMMIWERIENPVFYAIPVFAVFVLCEATLLAFDERREGRRGYSKADTRASLLMGTGATVSIVVFKTLSLLLFVLVWEYLAPWRIPYDNWWSWVLLFIIADLAFYMNHRFSHRVRIGWAAHQAHHSSEFFNFGTALRQKWNPWSEAIFWLPIPLLGFEPWTIYIVFGFNLIYQFFTHTEVVDKLPRIIEFLVNTPSHHRVHHGSDPEYLDKNYGGTLIIWDRMFGTFQPELHRPKYGLTKPVDTYNVFKLQFHEYGNIMKDVRNAKGLRERLGYVFAPPGWGPARHEPQVSEAMVAPVEPVEAKAAE